MIFDLKSVYYFQKLGILDQKMSFTCFAHDQQTQYVNVLGDVRIKVMYGQDRGNLRKICIRRFLRIRKMTEACTAGAELNVNKWWPQLRGESTPCILSTFLRSEIQNQSHHTSHGERNTPCLHPRGGPQQQKMHKRRRRKPINGMSSEDPLLVLMVEKIKLTHCSPITHIMYCMKIC